MKCLMKIIVCMVAVVFIGLTTYQNLSHADEIADLKRKLEYLETRQVLDAELELLQAQIKNKNLQINKLESDYQDVITATPAEQTVSLKAETPAPSSEPASSEPASSEPASSEPAFVGKGADYEWTASDGRCGDNRQMFRDIMVDEYGNFSLVAFNGSWNGKVTGNLMQSEAEGNSNSAAYIRGFKAEQDGEKWKLVLTWSYTGGLCQVRTTLE